MTSTRDAALHPSGAGPSSSKKAPSSPGFVLIMSVMLLVPVQPASAHPQCLDFEPPFKPPWHLEFCAQYEQFGCCDQKTDNMIAERYWNIVDQLEVAGYELCADMLKEIMCQECSPYAAHLYDAEDPYTPVRELPGLCFGYCSEFHGKCRHVVKYLTENQLLRDTSERDVSTFCSLVDLSDQDYCYPNVLKSPDLNSNLGRVVEDPRGCLQLCLTEVANNLRNPVLMLHSGDDTHRMFIAEQLGFVWVYLRDGSRVEQPFLDMSGEVLSTPWLGDERGFLGMAFHPKYRDNGRFFIYTKAPATSSQVKPTTTSASITTTSTAAPTWKSPEKKARKKNTLKQRRKNKNLNKKGAKAKMKKKSRKKTEVAAVIKPVSDKIKAKANQTDTDKDALKTSNSLSDNTIHTKKKMRKRAQQQIRLEKDSVKMKESAVGYQSFMNKTKTSLNVKSNTTTRNKLQVKRDAKAL